MTKYGLVLPISEVPDGTKVCKVDGTIEYTVKREIKVYREGSAPENIVGDGVSFLVGDRGHINAYPNTKKVVWWAKEWELFMFLEKRNEERQG